MRSWQSDGYSFYPSGWNADIPAAASSSVSERTVISKGTKKTEDTDDKTVINIDYVLEKAPETAYTVILNIYDVHNNNIYRREYYRDYKWKVRGIDDAET